MKNAKALSHICKKAFVSGALLGAGAGGAAGAVRGQDADSVVRGAVRGAATGAGAHLGALGGGVLAHLLAKHLKASPKANVLATLTGAGVGGVGGGIMGNQLSKLVAQPKKDEKEEKPADEQDKKAFDHLAVKEDAGAPCKSAEKRAAIMQIVRRVINGDEGLDQLVNHIKSARSKKTASPQACK